MSDEEFRDLISENLTCRVTAGEDCGAEMEEYLSRCVYVAVRPPASLILDQVLIYPSQKKVSLHSSILFK